MKKENKISGYSAKILVETKCVDISLKKIQINIRQRKSNIL